MARKTVVVKIGSSSLTEGNGRLSLAKLEGYVSAIAELKKQGHEVILISSGAVSAGFPNLGYTNRPVTISGKQAAAAVGQGLLIQAYTNAFMQEGITAAQLLLTRDDFGHKEKYTNVYNTLKELLKKSVIPIINENDTVSIEELTFGDNDMLSALVSGLVNADHLLLLTDVNGLYKGNPVDNPEAERIDYLPEITGEYLSFAEDQSSSKVGTGGMKSKLFAAKTALSLGVSVFIGKGADSLTEVLTGNGDGTYIGQKPLHNMKKNKQWIALHSNVHGSITIDRGAETALIRNGKSLLPAGIKELEGDFLSGQVVEILNQDGKVIGRGEVGYSSQVLRNIKGLNSWEIADKTLELKPGEAVHRDKLYLFPKKEQLKI
ncbi:glutamate 5-kinase [Sediminibacillus massiliensis]|uniref:glutamate 5-kinase n=1 Tax=Sediminibacillus massiliensis TaxID=1926277 RepID=UPI00098830DD|nr:glutamate 5-kinase [Sediminibacillus massiliensis]